VGGVTPTNQTKFYPQQAKNEKDRAALGISKPSNNNTNKDKTNNCGKNQHQFRILKTQTRAWATTLTGM